MFTRATNCGKEGGYPHGRWYGVSLRGNEKSYAEKEAGRRADHNDASGYKNKFRHPRGQKFAHLLGCYGELAVSIGTGLEWSGWGQEGKNRFDVGHNLFPIEVKATDKKHIGLELTAADRRAAEAPIVLIQLLIYPDQVCCYPIGWQWRKLVPKDGLRRAELRDFEQLLSELEKRGHGSFGQATRATST